MRLVITDTGLIWNQYNPILEKYKEIVLIVCIEGKKITDKYECFVSPFKYMGRLGMDQFGLEDRKFQALASVAGELHSMLKYQEDIVFLTDHEPSTLYPYRVVKEVNKSSRLHLVAMPPFKFESKVRNAGYRKLIADLSQLDSFLYYDGQKKLDGFDKRKYLQDFFEQITDDFKKMMPRILDGIYRMKKTPCFFDFNSLEYVALEGDCDYVREEVERPVARLDGKKICSLLREQRLKLAAANGIPFDSEECPSIGPCAGTCEKCDREALFLRQEMSKIPEDERVYPQFDPTEEVAI